MLLSMVLSGLITFWHAILSRFSYDIQLQKTMDFGVFLGFAALYFIFQLSFIFTMLYQVVCLCLPWFCHPVFYLSTVFYLYHVIPGSIILHTNSGFPQLLSDERTLDISFRTQY